MAGSRDTLTPTVTLSSHTPPSVPLTPAKRTYFPELDGIRAIAIAMVMAFHLGADYIPGPVSLGQTGVDLFFVLSGFLITGILLKAPQRDWHEVRVFYIRRTLRIFPLYYFALIVVWTILMHDHVSWDVWVYLQNITITFNGWMRGPLHFWSLAVEEQFYLVWPFVVLFLPRRYLTRALVALIVIAFLSRIPLLHAGYGVFYLTFTRMDALAAGAVLALLQYHGKLAQVRPILLTILVAGLVLIAAEAKLAGNPSHFFILQLTRYSIFAATYASAVGLILTSRRNPLTSLLSSSPLRFVGRISYGLYVFHPLVYLWALKQFAGQPPFLRASLAVLATFACALASWYGMERYFIGLKDKLAPERARFPTSAPAMTTL
jgi:peptidoglycan/LPS O-acetylase OafA/YrhL